MNMTIPYVHSQNGLAKRCICTVIKGIHCLLAKSRLSKTLWAKALIPSSWHTDLVPEQEWTGKCQNIKFLHAFGSVAFAKVSKELVESKLDPRSIKLTFVEYCNNGYRLYDQRTWTIVTLHDMIFEEGRGHRSLTVINNDSGDLMTDVLLPPNPAIPGVLHLCQPIAPWICLTDRLLYKLTMTTLNPSHTNKALVPGAELQQAPASVVPASTAQLLC